jgi:hypothetical protein
MTNKLEIKFKNQKQFFEILEEDIVVELNTAKHNLKYKIPFEEIKSNQYIDKNKESAIVIAFYTSLLFNVLTIIYFISEYYKLEAVVLQSILMSVALSFIFVLKNYNEGHDEKHIESSKVFYFIYTKKNAPEVDAFIDLIYKKQIDFFRHKYFLIDPILPYTVQYERYIWLYSNKYINENEYEVIKEDLDKYFNFNINI